jgi:hypothetical protein
MFTKMFRISLALLMMALFITTTSEAQVKKAQYPKFSISPIGGLQFPIGSLNDNYGVSWNAGMDFSLKINKESAMYINATYFNMPKKTETGIGADASYMAITTGPRYYFISPNLKAQFFLEAGIGIYIFTQKEYTVTSPSLSDPTVTVPSVTKTVFGVTGGPGVTIPLGGSIDLLIKSKWHYTFHEGGAHTFISANAGIEFAF